MHQSHSNTRILSECYNSIHRQENLTHKVLNVLYEIKGTLSFAEAKEVLGIDQKELNRLIRDRKIPCQTSYGKKRVFNYSDLMDYLDKNEKSVPLSDNRPL